MDLSKLESLFKMNDLNYQFIGLKQVDSTSAYLKRQAKIRLEPTFCIAQLQTDGYGQRQRQWLSNEDSLTFSVLCRFSAPIHALEGLSQVIGLALSEALAEICHEKISIKWPNDLYLEAGKVAGLLIECVKFDENSCWLVIGVGINRSLMDFSKSSSKAPSYSVAYLPSFLEADVIRFLPDFISKIERLSLGFVTDKFKNYLENYQKYDYFDLDQRVIVYDTEQSISGCYKGLTQRGELLLESDGELIVYRSGEISIRAMDDI